MQAIIAWTKVNAELLGIEKEIGTLEVGKFAGIITEKDDPLSNITELQQGIFKNFRSSFSTGKGKGWGH